MKYLNILFFFFSQIVIAQSGLNDLSFQYLTINEGLSQNTVIAIAQDSSGFLWFGTRDGLNRYDGYTFKQFFNDISDTNSITSNEINAIDVAPNGILWIGTNNGLNAFNTKNGKVKRYFHNPNSRNSIANNVINVITHNSKGEVFIGTENGLSIFTEDEKFETFRLDESNSQKTNQIIKSIVLDFSGNLWIGGMQCLSKFDLKNKKFRKIILDVKGNNSNKPLVIQGLVFLNKAELWVATGFGLYKYDIINEKIVDDLNIKITYDPLVRGYMRELYKDSKGNIWFAEWNGLRVFDKNTEKLFAYGKSVEKGYLNNSAVNKILEDKSGVFWIGTSFGGVNYYDPTKKKFNTLNEKSGLSNNLISSVTEDGEGNIWIGTIGGGINRLDSANNVVEVITAENSKLKNNLIRILAMDENDMWIGDWGNILTKISLTTKEMRTLNLSDLGFPLHPSNAIKDIEIDEEKNVWVATSRNGIFKFIANGGVENYSNETFAGLSSNKVLEIFFDKNKSLWVLSENGLSKYSKAKNRFELFDIGKGTLGKVKMISVYVENKKIFWIGTYGHGLLKVDIKNKSFINYKAKSNIPNNTVYGILPDDDGNLWLSTNFGIAKFNPSTEVSNSFNIEDGLQSNEFNDNAFYKTEDGRLIFGGIGGVNIISPQSVNTNKFVPPIVLTNINLLNSHEDEKYYCRALNNSITLKYNESNLTVDFAALNFSQSDKNRYAYKLEPLNDNWISLGNKHSITFTNLENGKYLLKIKGSNNDGVWNNVGTELRIIVLPPFWLRWWFISFVLLLGVGIVSLIIYLKMRALIKVERLRTKIASDLHDDVGASLTKISMNASLLNYETGKSGISERVKTLNTLSQEVISMMSDIVWSIDARNDSVQDLIDRMKNFAFNNVDGNEIDVNFISTCSIKNQKLKINVRQNFYLIFKESFHNAVKYSKSKKFDVTIIASKEGIILTLIDNGIGLDEGKNRVGNGLRNMKMRASKINAELKIINENGLTIFCEVKKL